ncbi:uncharacterized protein EV422DRAFT_516083 [Fimicolochytrium jonesii]|uniref:uncharacterized protein n=1 Tax=Fimicolochytrium jonesii TaxID=1396493 RepID=UPI0022FED00F|nr:uncharacterized protein EV422DRAFT_516083 [Fimicolochytrium jonesii]KAI8826283.1 hypothetical protein EV422DRAFT_516083 [Fimicolochytrium jonesii]
MDNEVLALAFPDSPPQTFRVTSVSATDRIKVYLPENAKAAPVLSSDPSPTTLTLDSRPYSVLFTFCRDIVTDTHVVRLACRHRQNTRVIAVYRSIGPASTLPAAVARVLSAPCLHIPDDLPADGQLKIWEMTDDLGPVVQTCVDRLQRGLQYRLRPFTTQRNQVPILMRMGHTEPAERKIQQILDGFDREFVELVGWLGIEARRLATDNFDCLHIELERAFVERMGPGYDHKAGKAGFDCRHTLPGRGDRVWRAT